MPSPRRTARAARRAAAASEIRTSHHLQARCSPETASALAQLAAELGVSESEIIRDAVEARLFGSPPGATMQGPDQGYRIAKSTAGVIAKKMLHRAYEAMPQTFEEFQQLIDEEGV